MKVTKLFQFSPATVPTKNAVLKIQIVDSRYWATEIEGWYDSERNEFYYDSFTGCSFCREYIDTLAIVSWEYKY